MPSTQPVIADRPSSSTRAACAGSSCPDVEFVGSPPPFAKRPCASGSKVGTSDAGSRDSTGLESAMYRFLCVSLWVGCTRPHPSLPTLVHLHDPCAGLGIPVLHAVDDMHLLVGCSDTLGLWWSTDGGAPCTRSKVPRLPRSSTSSHPRAGFRSFSPQESPCSTSKYTGQAPRVHRATSSKRTSSWHTAEPHAPSTSGPA